MGRFVSKVLCASFIVVGLVGPLLSGGCDNHGPDVDMTTPADLTVVNPPDLVAPSSDLAGPADMAGPRDMIALPGDMIGPPRDMTGPAFDLSGPSADMTGPMVDLAGPPRDMTGPAVDMSMPPADMTGPRDMVVTPVDMAGPRDMVVTPVDMATPRDMVTTTGDMAAPITGGIGAACTSDAACKGGGAPKCWVSNVLNNPVNPATPGGYCSSTCSTDTDCGSGNRCVNLGAGNYCLAGCSNATTCRHAGYACEFYDTTGGICFSDSNLDCDPTGTGGTCTESGTGVAGGCLRQAYENKGICSAGCTLGTACAARGGARQCIYLDASRVSGGSMDKWKGLLCIQSPATPANPGDPCMYLNQCKDGYECDGATSTCQQLCTKGGSPMCTTGMCADAFGTPTTGPGLCR